MALNDKPSHFFGSIVSCAHGRDEILIIDGQQRITTVSLLLLAIVNAIKSGELGSLIRTEKASFQYGMVKICNDVKFYL